MPYLGREGVEQVGEVLHLGQLEELAVVRVAGHSVVAAAPSVGRRQITAVLGRPRLEQFVGDLSETRGKPTCSKEIPHPQPTPMACKIASIEQQTSLVKRPSESMGIVPTNPRRTPSSTGPSSSG